MPKVWKISVNARRIADNTLVPMRETYIVAVGDTEPEALRALHAKENLDGAELVGISEVPASVAEYLDVQPGHILCFLAIR
jgi:hypothetical protein